jgi:hypothetical protein
MKNVLPILALLPALGACAPLVTQTAAPTKVNTSVTYLTPASLAGQDNPVLAAVVGIAPSAPVTAGRQPWRAEEIERNSVVLRSNATRVDVSTTTRFIQTLPYEMSWNVISSGTQTTLNAVYSSQYAASAQYIFDQLDQRFSRVK